MKISTPSILATLVAVTYAAPTSRTNSVNSRQEFKVGIECNGAAGAFYSLSIPTDDTEYPITNPLSVSSITTFGGGLCSFFGVDGLNVFVPDMSTVVVGPPQTLTSVICDSA